MLGIQLITSNYIYGADNDYKNGIVFNSVTRLAIDIFLKDL